MKSEYAIEQVLRLWDIQLKKIREDIPIAGSPDRCLFRTVIENREGRFYVLENVSPVFILHKQKIAQTLAYLAENGATKVCAYLPLVKDKYIASWQNQNWQLSPYIAGIPLERPQYAFEAWRGTALADFLIELWKQSENIPFFDKSAPFSIVSFNRNLFINIKSREPVLYDRIAPAVDFLEEKFARANEDIPVRFCHGDFHSLNVVWSATGINTVIDWEFLGYKPEIYDIAMQIGCLGMEKPQSLTGDLVFAFVKRLKEFGHISELSWSYLFEYVLALRFAWLSDWLKRSDSEMIDLEAVYIQILLDNRELFIKSWGTGDYS